MVSPTIKFVQQFDIAKGQAVHREDSFASEADAVLFLVMKDTRDVPTAQKISDAAEFIHSSREDD